MKNPLLPCDKCGYFHLEETCEEAKKNYETFVKRSKVYAKEVSQHEKDCAGCPNPHQHVLGLGRGKLTTAELSPGHRVVLRIIHSGWCPKCKFYVPRDSLIGLGHYWTTEGDGSSEVRARCNSCHSWITGFANSTNMPSFTPE